MAETLMKGERRKIYVPGSPNSNYKYLESAYWTSSTPVKIIYSCDQYAEVEATGNGTGSVDCTAYYKKTSSASDYSRYPTTKHWSFDCKGFGPDDVGVSPHSKTIMVGEKFTITCTITGESSNITWYSDDENIASVYSSSNSYCEVKGKKAGTTWIWAKASNGKEDYCRVTVEGGIPVSEIKLNYTSKTLEINDNFQLKETIKPDNATDKSVSWSSSNKSVATVSSDGLVKAMSHGKTTITCEAKDGSGVKAICSIDVQGVDPERITLSPKSRSAYVGSKFQIVATLEPANANPTITWTSDNESIASVSSGWVEAKGVGIATITAKTINGKTDKCQVIVEKAPKPTGKVKKVVTGWYNDNTFFVMSDGSCWACGDNSAGQFGNGTKSSTNPNMEKVMSNVSMVSPGRLHSLFLKNDNTLWACGANAAGQLGDGTNIDRTVPVKIMSDVAFAYASRFHSLIIKKDGTLWTCGSNDGKLGDGTETNRNVPVKILSDVKEAYGGSGHSLIIKKDGTLWTCGYGDKGQLGNGTWKYMLLSPVKIMSDVQTAAVGYNHSLVLKKDGTLWAFGENNYGQLGDGTIKNRNTPVKIMSDVTFIGAGSDYSLIVKKDGTLWACGNNENGQFGDGLLTKWSNSPVKIMDDVSYVTAGLSHTIIVKKDGSIWACGRNYYGQFGDGTTTNHSTPVKIMDGDHQSTLKGDVNGDSMVDGMDVIKIVNMILGRSEKNDAADVNDDQMVDGMDVVHLVNIILGRASARNATKSPTNMTLKANLSIEPFAISSGDKRDMLLTLTSHNTKLTLLQLDILLPKGLSIITSQIGEQTTALSHQLLTNAISDRTRLLLFSDSNKPIDNSEVAIVHLTVSANDDYQGGTVDIVNAMGVTPGGEKVIIPTWSYSLDSDTEEISSVGAEKAETVIYNLTGQRQSIMPKKGIYIINGKKKTIK